MSSYAIFSNQIGYAEETVYGTRVPPTRFLDFTKESIKRSQERRESAGIRAGSIVRRSDSQSAVMKGAAGSVEHEIADIGFGLLLKHMLRKTPSSTTPAGGVKRFTFTLGTEVLSLTTQVGRVKADGSGVAPFDYLGCVVSEWKISQEVDAYALLELTLDAQNEKTDQTLAEPSYGSSPQLFHDGELLVKVSGTGVDVRTAEISGNSGLKTDRYYLRRNTLKKVPLNAEFVGLEGALNGDFEDLTIYNHFVAGDLVEIIYEWVGPQIGSTGYNNELKITMPSCVFTGETPETAAPGILEENMPFVIFDNGTNPPITIDYQTSDSAI